MLDSLPSFGSATVPYHPVTIAPSRPLRRNAISTMEAASVVVAGISPATLVSLLSGQDCSQWTLVLDCRPFMAYNTGHVVDALNVHCPPILKRRSGGFVSLEHIVPDPQHRERLKRGGYRSVVLYDQAAKDLAGDRDMGGAPPASNLSAVVRSLVQQLSPGQVDRVFFLVGGYEAFSQDCPMLCATQQFSPLSGARPDSHLSAHDSLPQPVEDQPVEILPHLWLGNGQHSSSLELLQRLGMTALVNVSTSCPNHFQAAFRYLHVPVNDSASEDLSAWFPQANRFIDEVKREGGKVLVHCRAGRSRSATICLAYLMSSLNLSFDDAFDHVRSRRHVIDPNLNFMRQLQDYRRRLDGEQMPSTPATLPLATSPLSAVGAAGGGAAFLEPSPRTPREAPSPLCLPSLSLEVDGGVSALTATSLPLTPPPPSPAPVTTTAADLQCFFSFSELPFPARRLHGHRSSCPARV